MTPKREPAERSVATGDDGTTAPAHTKKITQMDEAGDVYAAGWSFDGGEYDTYECWIRCNLGDLRDIEQ